MELILPYKKLHLVFPVAAVRLFHRHLGTGPHFPACVPFPHGPLQHMSPRWVLSRPP